MTHLVPYSFNTDVLPLEQGQELPGTYQGIHFTVEDPDNLDMLMDKIEGWFEDRDEVILVDHGQTARGMGFIVMEWEGYAIDALFIAILKHDDMIDDYSVYTRDAEV
jgi:hypothetical protein